MECTMYGRCLVGLNQHILFSKGCEYFSNLVINCRNYWTMNSLAELLKINWFWLAESMQRLYSFSYCNICTQPPFVHLAAHNVIKFSQTSSSLDLSLNLAILCMYRITK